MLVSGGCEGDVKIWNAQKGLQFLMLYKQALTSGVRRQMHKDHSCPSRLRHCCALQPRRKPHCFVRSRRSHVGHIHFGHAANLVMKTLAVSGIQHPGSVSKPWRRATTLYGNSHSSTAERPAHMAHIANTYSSLRIRSTFSRLRMIVRSVCGTTRRHDA